MMVGLGILAALNFGALLSGACPLMAASCCLAW